ncbi:MAG: carbohydrate ABC transporter permease [Oscillospiraceae bacterium]|jgi:ABC-type glycerol-3-phosphate transport system permease component|nr:carbohydrate ABC transporter permease [Oscillospiraceae bacterium]
MVSAGNGSARPGSGRGMGVSAKRRKPIRLTPSDMAFNAVMYIVLAFVLAAVAYPLVFVLSASFSEPYAVISGQVWLYPVRFSTVGYTTIFKDAGLMRSFLNSVQVTLLGTVVNLVCTVMAAYPLSVKTFVGRGVFMGILSFTMFFGGGLIPFFLLVRNLGLYNTYWALVLPGAISVYNVIVARTFFSTSIPYELCEAAELDGCSDIYYLTRVVLPLSAPILAVLVMYYAVGHWNAYFNHMIFLKDKAKFTFQITLRSILIQNQNSDMMIDASVLQRQQGLADLLKYSLIVVSSTPMLLLYPFIQKHFVKGVMVGAIKG